MFMKFSWFLLGLVASVSVFLVASPWLMPFFSGEVNTESFVPKTGGSVSPANVSANATPPAPNPRWNHFPLKFFVDARYPNLTPSFANDVRNAFALWKDASDNLATFEEVATAGEADITISWVNELKSVSTDSIGDTNLKFVDLEKFKVIQRAEIELLTKEGNKPLSDLDTTNLAIHEIGHALGLSHSPLTESIMYPKLTLPSRGTNKISALDLQNLQETYRLPVKPDLALGGVNATKFVAKTFFQTRYFLNLSVTTENIGLADVNSATLEIKTDGRVAKTSELSEISLGSSLLLTLGNLEISEDFSRLEITVDPQNLVGELDEGNNKIILEIQEMKT